MAHIITLPNGKIELHDVWGYDDIQNVQECREEKELTQKQCKKVIELLASSFDANEGINWEVIEVAIDTVLGE